LATLDRINRIDVSFAVEQLEFRHQRKCYQWYWRSDQPIFNGKNRCYVGMDGSPQVLAARQAIERRKELDWVERQLKILERSHADAT
jgi:GH43 family beta-xylosidase